MSYIECETDTDAVVNAAITRNTVATIYNPEYPSWGYVIYWVDQTSDQVLIESSITGTQLVNQEQASAHYLNLVHIAPTHYGAGFAINISGRKQ